jgi:hypothetical protein
MRVGSAAGSGIDFSKMNIRRVGSGRAAESELSEQQRSALGRPAARLLAIRHGYGCECPNLRHLSDSLPGTWCSQIVVSSLDQLLILFRRCSLGMRAAYFPAFL